MSINYSTLVKTTRLYAVLNMIDAGPGSGFIEICSANNLVLASIYLTEPAGTIDDDVLTLTMPQSASADATGTATTARIKYGSGSVVADGLTVGTSDTDIILTSVGITAGDQVNLTSAIITHA